jgi:hypothetical protein
MPPLVTRPEIWLWRSSGIEPKEVANMKRALMRMLKMMMGKDGKSST